MPLVGWIKECSCDADFTHKNGEGREVDCVSLPHYTACPTVPIPRTLACAIYADTQTVRYDREDWVPSASQIDSCPIETYYKNKADYVEPVLDRRFMLRGTFAHEGILGRVIDGDTQERFLIEEKMGLPLVYPDETVFTLYGTLDCYDKIDKTIYDLKTQLEYAVKKKMEQTDQEMMDDPRVGQFTRQNMNQVNIYKVLAEESLGVEVKKLELQYWNGALEVRRMNVPILPKKRLLAVMHQKFRILYDAVNGNIPLSADISPFDSVNRFPMNKSPVKYLVREHFN